MTLDVEELFNRLNTTDQVELTKLAHMVTELWVPQPGPQTLAYFCDADELLYGGSAGGGKSDLLVGYALNNAHNAVIFRNGLKNVRDLENRAIAVRKTRDGFTGMYHTFDLGDGRSLELDSLEQPGSEQNWQGRRRDFFGFDEAAQMSKARIQFVQGWVGSAKPGARSRVIYATNPPLSDEGNWLITWFAPWIDPLFPKPAKPGQLRWFVNDAEGDPVWVKGPGQYDRGDGTMSTAKSRTFIPSSLNDNAYLRDTDYRSRVEALPEPMRSAMLNGNFMAARKDHAFQVLPADWIRAAQARWTEDGDKQPMVALGADVAGGGADRECLAALHVGNWFARPKIAEGVDTKDGAATAGRIIAAQRNGAPIAIDMTGGWGGASKQALSDSEVDVVGVVFSSASGSVDKTTKIPYYNLRAEMYWEFRQALNPNGTERIALPPDAAITAEGTAPRWKLQGGKILIESKEDIRARLGSSTDVLDAIIIAWHIRGRGLVKQKQGGPPKWSTQTQDDNPFKVDGY
ncbi:Terminase-like family [uncultured Caudovirales phage]|uniref:Terminase-like family n=1 Tax=uncultured Caudovirales phage TaxID=2100421 RepID=A0A6J7VPF8_9CAUD|nr:Terminase-like family [uncultured Caudovirales phage]